MSQVHSIISAELVADIVRWGSDRNIINGSKAPDQFFKLSSEAGEFAEGVIKNDGLEIKDGIGDAFVVATLIAKQLGSDIITLFEESSERHGIVAYNNDLAVFVAQGKLGDALAKKQIAKAREFLGDLAFELVRAAPRHGLGINTCLAAAYADIKDRKGVMYNGIFVKSTDETYAGILAELGLAG